MREKCFCPTCGVRCKRARHRGRYCEKCWSDWLDVSLGNLSKLTDLTDPDRGGIGQVGAGGVPNLTDFAPPYKGGRSVKSASTSEGEYDTR